MRLPVSGTRALTPACPCEAVRAFAGEGAVTIERMILLVVGVVVVGSVLLAVYHSLNWLWLTGPMGALLSKHHSPVCVPWSWH